MSVTQLADGRWRVRWRTPDGKRPQATFRTKKAAQKYERDRLDEIEQGIGWVDPTATFRDFWPDWRDATKPSVSVRAWESYEGHWRNHLDDLVGDTRLAVADTRLVQDVINHLTREKKAAKTVRGIAGTLTSMIGMAAAQGRCKPLPRERELRPRLPQVKRRQLIIPTPSEVSMLAEAIIAPLHAMVLLCGAGPGLRQGEAIGLHPADIDWERRRIYVHQRVHKTTGQREEGTKEDAGKHVFLPSLVADALKAHVEEYPNHEWVFHRDGKPYTASMVDKAWRAACGQCGLSGIRFHDLRHASASLLIQAGWNVKRVQTQMRHATAAFTLDTYGHLFDEDTGHAQEQLDAALMAALAHSKGRVTT